MNLILTRPLVTFDLETTGKDTQTARIIQYALVKLHPDGARETLTYLVNPEMPIPPDSIAVHGITDEMVRDLPTFHHHGPRILEFFQGCDLCGFNVCAYDVPVLFNELARVKIDWDHQGHHIVDAGSLFKIREPRTLSAAVKFYCGIDMKDAHDALADTMATLDVLVGQLSRYEGLPSTIEELALYTNYGQKRADLTGKFTVNDAGEYEMNFGKEKGRPAKDCKDFLRWMLSKDFPKDAQAICREILYPAKAVNSLGMSYDPNDDLPF